MMAAAPLRKAINLNDLSAFGVKVLLTKFAVEMIKRFLITKNNFMRNSDEIKVDEIEFDDEIGESFFSNLFFEDVLLFFDVENQLWICQRQESS